MMSATAKEETVRLADYFNDVFHQSIEFHGEGIIGSD